MHDAAAIWDEQAEGFDDEPDHGLRDPAVRAAWRGLLAELIPEPPVRVADLGCGTGSLAVLLAQAGHQVCGIDLAPRMIARAQAKARAAEVRVDLAVGDAAAPALPPNAFDVVLARHVLWVLPDPGAALRRWTELLAPRGQLVLIEGRWSTGAGLTADQSVALLAAEGRTARVRPLPDPVYWGRAIADERYVVVSPPSDAS